MIYIHFNIFSLKKKKKTDVTICIFVFLGFFLKNLSQVGPFHTATVTLDFPFSTYGLDADIVEYRWYV